MIDFHSHVLPGMDDGAADTQTSLAILQKEQRDGVDTIVATPHFYLEQNGIDDFIARRQTAYERLMQAAAGMQLPKIILGAEVLYTPSLTELGDLSPLCIGSSGYILLEMPYQRFSQQLFRGIDNLLMRHNHGFVMAHIERYASFTDMDDIFELMDRPVLGQVNCGSLLRNPSRKIVLGLLEDGIAQVIGSDVHNMKTRPPLYGECLRVLKKKLAPDRYQAIMDAPARILNGEAVDTLMDDFR